jgi:ligand-binding sensor domain-containing protein
MPGRDKYVWFVCLAFIPIKAGAQHLPFINYNTHNGLPQIQVQRLYQDSKGYIWVGTKGGLAKFNGSTFQHFLHNEYIYGIGETLNGELYFITLNNLYKQERGTMKHVASLNGQMYLITGRDSYWVYTNSEMKEFRADTLYQTIQSGIDFEGIFTGRAYDRENDRLLFSTSTNKVYGLKDKEITELSAFESQVMVSSFSNGFIYYHLLPSATENIYVDPESREMLLRYKDDTRIHDVEIHKLPVRKHVLYNYYIRQYLLLDSAASSVQPIELPFEEEVYPFIIDKDDNCWLGTDNGLYQLNNKSFRAYPRTFMNNFWTMIRGKDGNYYGGQYKVGLFRLDLAKQEKKEIMVKGPDGAYYKEFYYGSSMDKQGNLYFPTHFGLVKYDYKEAKFFDIGISMISKYDPYEDRILFGHGLGIGFIDSDERIEAFTDSTGKILTFYPSALEFTSNGNVWIGNRSGLVFFDKEDKQLKHVSTLHYDVYPSQQLISMAKDHEGNVWMGGNSELWLYNGRKDSFTHVGKDFFNTKILSLISPDSTLLLIGTSREIFAMRLDKFYRDGTIEFKMFNHRNGFFSEEVAQNGFLLDGDRIFIPSSTSTSELYYNEISFTPDYFNLFVTSINETGLSKEEQSDWQPFYVEKGNNRLTINYETVGFGLPTYPVFKYKLEGKDKDWSDWTQAKSAYYSGLGSGKYTFRVVAKTGDKLAPYEEKESSVEIIIDMPFFREPYFFKYVFFVFALLTLILAFLIWIAYKTRIAVQARERHIKLLEVGTLQSQLSPHFIFNFLSSIQNLIGQKQPEKANDYLVKFSRLIRAYMESSIKSSRLLGRSILENENSIKEEIDMLTTYVELEKMKYPDKQITFEVELESDSLLNRTIPPMLLQPFVENAIKHGILPKEGAGRVTVRFEEDGDTFVCKIMDDGIGRERSVQNREKSIKAHKSRGLQLIMQRVQLLNELNYNINIDFEDPESGGTTVIITIQN